MHFLEELGWDEELGRVLVPGTHLFMGIRNILSELDIRENLPIIADFWVKAIFPI